MPRTTTRSLVLASFVALVGLGACVDNPTEVAPPRADAPPVTTEFQQPAVIGLDAHYLELARDVPGFGGAYVDEAGRTVVHMAGRDLAAEGDRIREGLRGRVAGTLRPGVDGPMAASGPDGLVLQESVWNYQELVEFHGRAGVALSMPGAVYTDIDERINRIAIAISDPAYEESFRTALEARGVPPEALEFRVSEPIVPLKGSSLVERVQPFGGGLQLIYPHPTPGFVFLCTLGFNVLGDFPGKSVNYFLTNSHCSSNQGVSDGTPYYQQGLALPEAKNLVAREVFDPPYLDCGGGFVCRYSDATVAMYETRKTPVKHGVIYRPESVNTGSLDIGDGRRFFTIADRADFPLGGEMLSKVGRTSGWTEGPVFGTCVDVAVSGTNIGLLCQDLVAAGVAGGDSGSPVFMRDGSSDDVTLYGILWGGGGGFFAFSSLFNIEFELGAFGVN